MKKTSGFGGCQAQSSKIMQHHAKPCKIMSCKNHAKSCKTRYSSRPYIDIRTRRIAFCSAKPCKKKAILPGLDGQVYLGRASNRQKTGPVKKEWQVGRDNDSRSRRPRTAAPGLARGRMEPSRARTGSLRAALARGRAAGPGGAALLLHLAS